MSEAPLSEAQLSEAQSSEAQSSEALVPTPGQTIGPFFGFALPFPGGDTLAPSHHPAAVRLHGRVLDGHGQPIPDALIEVWQLDEHGGVAQQPGTFRRRGYQPSSGAHFFDDHTFTGFGRAMTDNDGHYAFATLRPGAAEPGRAAYFCLTVFSRGLMNRLFTRAYLPADPGTLAADPLLGAVPDDRRSTLLTTADGERSLRFDVVLQGEGETVFLTYPGYAEPPLTPR